MPNRAIATAAICLFLLVPSRALAEPSGPQKRVQQAAKAIEECAKKSCDAKEMKKRFAALEAAREALDASLTEKADEERDAAKTSSDAPDVSSSDEEDEDVVTPPPPEPPPPRPTASWMAPPEFRLGAEPLPPPDTSEGGVRMRREHLGAYWMGLGLLTGGGIGLAASAGYVASNAEGARDFGEVAPGVVLGVINLCALITGASLLDGRGELVPDTSLRIEPTHNGLAIRF